MISKEILSAVSSLLDGQQAGLWLKDHLLKAEAVNIEIDDNVNFRLKYSTVVNMIGQYVILDIQDDFRFPFRIQLELHNDDSPREGWTNKCYVLLYLNQSLEISTFDFYSSPR
ncbi:hypothetical protein DC3_51060 [Deinococcus cellulosilyticus NBRC 106333 = KACC 11606]|uniref:Uncharacterized protein n=1 Tax=Deinococcus cellulosilyticus (strain DSM 18568 / NBRC 106333 / KACC 11606 / 5516J-15) TaxID=1223518 RepID=A0A511NAS6_DEIC1|nr:hypothetical protein DC3_51060 [Deinococcus cellulosilyticus NBRC 106333 = KACC 11606]